jgi:hypothetical protein
MDTLQKLTMGQMLTPVHREGIASTVLRKDEAKRFHCNAMASKVDFHPKYSPQERSRKRGKAFQWVTQLHISNDIYKELKNVNPILISGLSEYRYGILTQDLKSLLNAWGSDSDLHVSHDIQIHLQNIGIAGTFPVDDEQDAAYKQYATNIQFTKSSDWKELIGEAYLYQQAAFKSLNIKEITLYRGYGDPLSHLQAGSKTKLPHRPASSWSSNPKVACGFGYRVIKITVPVTQILFSPILHEMMDGHSKLGEAEYVVIGASDLECEVLSIPFNTILPSGS